MIFYGAGGHAKVVIESWVASGGKVMAIFDDNELITSLLGMKVSSNFESKSFQNPECLVSVGLNAIRKKIVEKINADFGKVIHPRSILSPSCRIEQGTVVMANVVVNAETVIGRHCILNTSSSVDHDCSLGDYVHVAPGATICGGVQIGEGTLIGAGAVILPGIRIGSWAVIGAGSVVHRDVPDKVIMAGNPAKRISFK